MPWLVVCIHVTWLNANDSNYDHSKDEKLMNSKASPDPIKTVRETVIKMETKLALCALNIKIRAHMNIRMEKFKYQNVSIDPC